MDASLVNAAIPFADWQAALGSPGVVLGGIDELDQAVVIIVSTPLRSDAHRPDFGCGASDYLDSPQNVITAHMVREVFAAVERWEPRVRLVSVGVEFEESNVILDINWRPTSSAVAVQNTRVRLSR